MHERRGETVRVVDVAEPVGGLRRFPEDQLGFPFIAIGESFAKSATFPPVRRRAMPLRDAARWKLNEYACMGEQPLCFRMLKVARKNEGIHHPSSLRRLKHIVHLGSRRLSASGVEVHRDDAFFAAPSRCLLSIGFARVEHMLSRCHRRPSVLAHYNLPRTLSLPEKDIRSGARHCCQRDAHFVFHLLYLDEKLYQQRWHRGRRVLHSCVLVQSP